MGDVKFFDGVGLNAELVGDCHFTVGPGRFPVFGGVDVSVVGPVAAIIAMDYDYHSVAVYAVPLRVVLAVLVQPGNGSCFNVVYGHI